MEPDHSAASSESPNWRPKLRAVDVRPVMHENEAYFMLRDPQQLTDEVLLVPEALGPALSLFDGSWDALQIESILTMRYGLELPPGLLGSLIKALDEAYMLDNANAAGVQAQRLTDYRNAPHRPPTLAGASYPAEPDVLRQMFDLYLEQAGPIQPAPADWPGLLSPHIDYQRGGSVYAKVWKRAAEMARAAEVVVILGTDHFSPLPGSLTLTRQSYATPYGVLPTDTAAVDALAEALGPEAFAGELRHLGEHSIELVAVWLHHMRGGAPVPVVPILTGSFSEYMAEGVSPYTDARLKRLVEALKTVTAGRRTLIVSSGDLSHVGPAFEGAALTANDKRLLQGDDAQVLDLLCDGDDEGFYNALQRTRNSTNICGLSPTYLALKAMGPVEGERVAYDVCPADAGETSVVTIGGVVFERV
ncbi:MAG: AmmeMemoRadiSam system protein B [Anaerolineales bacterium]|nr:AmmeMemoRadiSam system protein B [Anaerolineales bacterium]